MLPRIIITHVKIITQNDNTQSLTTSKCQHDSIFSQRQFPGPKSINTLSDQWLQSLTQTMSDPPQNPLHQPKAQNQNGIHLLTLHTSSIIHLHTITHHTAWVPNLYVPFPLLTRRHTHAQSQSAQHKSSPSVAKYCQKGYQKWYHAPKSIHWIFLQQQQQNWMNFWCICYCSYHVHYITLTHLCCKNEPSYFVSSLFK